jgi:hypothetical protein
MSIDRTARDATSAPLAPTATGRVVGCLAMEALTELQTVVICG